MDRRWPIVPSYVAEDGSKQLFSLRLLQSIPAFMEHFLASSAATCSTFVCLSHASGASVSPPPIFPSCVIVHTSLSLSHHEHPAATLTRFSRWSEPQSYYYVVVLVFLVYFFHNRPSTLPVAYIVSPEFDLQLCPRSNNVYSTLQACVRLLHYFNPKPLAFHLSLYRGGGGGGALMIDTSIYFNPDSIVF